MLVCGGVPLHLLDVLIEAGIVAARGILRDEHRHTVHLFFGCGEVGILHAPGLVGSPFG